MNMNDFGSDIAAGAIEHAGGVTAPLDFARIASRCSLPIAVANAASGKDVLTGVMDRAALITVANDRCARGIALTVLTVDINGFTTLNQQLGWYECDRLLQAVAYRCSRLAESVLAPALVSRIGADEFAIVFEAGDDSARAIADARIRALQCGLEAPFDARTDSITLDFTWGRCELPSEAEDAQGALVHATAARLDGPVAGDNVSHYAEYRSECSLLLELRRAVSSHRLQIAWQPQLELALRDFARWHAGDVPVARIAVNMSSAQFQRSGLAQRVSAALARHALPPGCLDIEITESVLLCHIPTIVGTLRELHALGITLPIDDFADRIGLCVIAEGIETDAQLELLASMGCVEGQGFLMARPMTADEFSRWARAR